MKLVTTTCLLGLIVSAQGWAFSPKTAKMISRKGFLVGVATGAVVVGTVSAAGPAVAVNAVNNQAKNRPGPYEPAAGSMVGQVVLVTGGSTGLGLESAKRLAAAGATIVLTSRTVSKGEKAVESVNEHLREKGIGDDNAKVYSLVLDLDDLESVKSFPSSYKQLGLGTIDVLMNNAGVMAIPDRQLTKDGYERTFQSNHLGHFVLTAGLFPYLSREKATVINVSSEAFNFAPNGLELDNLNGEKKVWCMVILWYFQTSQYSFHSRTPAPWRCRWRELVDHGDIASWCCGHRFGTQSRWRRKVERFENQGPIWSRGVCSECGFPIDENRARRCFHPGVFGGRSRRNHEESCIL